MCETKAKPGLILTASQEEEFVRRPAVRLFIPDTLKSILVDDWEKVTKEQKLVPMPSPTPISLFLNDYYEAESIHRRPGSADADILEEVIAGVKEYFNKALGRILLYRFERPQFYEVHKQVESGHGEHAGKTLCDMYGCEHLLRLFGKLTRLRHITLSMLTHHSLHAGSDRAHQHGLSICQPPQRGVVKDDSMAGKEGGEVPLGRLRARRARLS